VAREVRLQLGHTQGALRWGHEQRRRKDVRAISQLESCPNERACHWGQADVSLTKQKRFPKGEQWGALREPGTRAGITADHDDGAVLDGVVSKQRLAFADARLEGMGVCAGIGRAVLCKKGNAWRSTSTWSVLCYASEIEWQSQLSCTFYIGQKHTPMPRGRQNAPTATRSRNCGLCEYEGASGRGK